VKITNKSNFPEALVKAVVNDSYNKGACDFSVTELLKPPRQRALMIKHAEELEEDVEDRIWALLGQVVHGILERANMADLCEKRFFATIDGFIVSAQIDSLSLDGNGVLTDWKCTTVYKFKDGEPPPDDYVAQLNMQLEILRQNGLDAKALQIVGILRDYSPSKSRTDYGYPKKRVVKMPLPMWSREQTVSFMKERIALHLGAEKSLPECTGEERWMRDEAWAVMKKGAKRSTKNHTNQISAQEHAKSLGPAFSVEHRPGFNTRCEDYCAVSSKCLQFQKLKANSKDESEGEKDAV
jgi:hypothetical protein